MSEREGAQGVPAREHAAVLDRLRALEEAADRIGATLGVDSVCRETVAFLRDRLCDAAAVDLLPEPVDLGDQRPEAAPPAAPSTARRAAQVGPEDLLDHTDTSRTVSVPLAAHGLLHGTLLAARAEGPFTAHERATLRTAAQMAATHLGHARRLAATEETALHLQRALVAEPGRPHPNLEIAGRYLPSGPRTLVGGDWFETVRLHFGRSLLVVGDVMGHGLDAAVDMNAYRSALREVASTDLPPHRVLRQLDTVVAEDRARRPATCLLVRVDPTRGAAGFASAGHLPPVVFTADGSADIVEVPVGPPLGTGFGGYELGTRELAASETLLLFTDGLVERRGEDIDVSLERLAALRMRPGAAPEEVVEEVLRRLDARHAEDDVAVLAARIRDRGPVPGLRPDARPTPFP
ncbi:MULTISPECIES: PP2C family protein-serine/threonine phosphatase [Streptomyces]|uniref:PP2C family protein-serine/threonine phosphatase n=1 Tax=Streptomyces solicathayae TaxID=3081768 RepID=A0ABZ0LL51_9ACTN|nr:PP2C family protein-serine/threonine phosphatase [Streptomyces sp. HUAS YS2]WOX20216.1 PP2C family protein-serine/threonine phosphatase [Streptomyces sp. HUAS YS2]